MNQQKSLRLILLWMGYSIDVRIDLRLFEFQLMKVSQEKWLVFRR